MLTVLGVSEDVYIDPKRGKRYKKWDCQCECGNIVSLRTCTLKKGNNVGQMSCGCYKREKAKLAKLTHGDSNTRLYNIWEGMIRRCYQRQRRQYKSYGGRGITVCDEWRNDYLTFKKWALDNNYSDNLTIDRIDVNGNYCPENCRWIPFSEQSKNRTVCNFITIGDKTQIQADWAREYGINPDNLSYRLKHGWELIEALTTPVGKRRSSKTNNVKETNNGTGT